MNLVQKDELCNYLTLFNNQNYFYYEKLVIRSQSCSVFAIYRI